MRSDLALLQQAGELIRQLGQSLSGRAVPGWQVGQNAVRRAGSGQEFWQYRPYEPTDAASRIDWRRSARGNRLYVREQARDVPFSLRIRLDHASGMDYSSGNFATKTDVALVLGLVLAGFALIGHDAVGVQDFPARRGGALPDILRAAWQPCTLWQAGKVTGCSHLVVVTDGLHPLPDIVSGLQGLAPRAVHRGLVLLADPAETSFPFAGRIRFSGLTDQPDKVFGQAEMVRDGYRQARRAHVAAIHAAAGKHGWQVWEHVTSQTLLPLLQRMTDQWNHAR